MTYNANCRIKSDLFNGHNTNKEERLLQYFSDGLTEDDSRFHILISYDSVLLVILLNLHTDLVNEVSDLINGQFLNWIVQHIVKLDKHGCEVSLLGVGDLEWLFLGELGDLFAGQAWFSDDWAHSDIGVDKIDGGVALGVKHFLEGEDVVRDSVLLQVVVLDWGYA